MKKLWLLARNNILKAKSSSIILIILFIIASFLLNAGLLVAINYGSHFEELKEELLASDAYYFMPNKMYNDEIIEYIDNSEHIKEYSVHQTFLLASEIVYQDKEQSFNVIFQDADISRDISKWKFIDERLPVGDMEVYVPAIFKSVSNYKLNDKIELKYTDESDKEQVLTFTIKGYIDDVFFSSTDLGVLSFYINQNTYEKIGNLLGDEHLFNIIFTNVDDLKNVSFMENEMRDILKLNSASLMGEDMSQLFLSLDIELVTLSRSMMASVMSIMMVVFAVIIVAVCLLVVRFRIVNSIEDDVVKMGSLKSIGYTSKQIIKSIIFQFLVLSGLGSLIGIVLSYPFLPMIAVVFQRQSGLNWEQGIDFPISSLALLILILVVVLVTIFSARRIKKLNPIDALRGEFSKNKYKRNVFKLENTNSSLTSALAFKSILMNIKQNIMIFTILIAVTFSGAFGVIMYYNTSVDTKAFSEVPGMEICNVMATLNTEKDNTDILNQISDMNGVRKIQFLDEVKVKVDNLDASAYVMDNYSKRESILVYEGHYPEADKEITLAGILASRINKKVGDTVVLEANGNKETFKVVGLSNGASMGGINVSILVNDFKGLNPDFKQQILLIYLNKDVDTAEFIDILKSSHDKDILLGAANFDKLMAEGMASYQSIVKLMGIVMLMITLSVVALVLYFMINSSVIRKKRELGIEKALGFTTFQLMNQVSIVFMVPIVIGAVTGAVLGASYTNTLMSLTMRGMGTMKMMLIVDGYWISAFTILTIIFSYLLSLLITWQIRRISAYALVTE